jgi:hypothetical protein
MNATVDPVSTTQVASPIERFHHLYGTKQEVFRAPGRVNLIGIVMLVLGSRANAIQRRGKRTSGAQTQAAKGSHDR